MNCAEPNRKEQSKAKEYRSDMLATAVLQGDLDKLPELWRDVSPFAASCARRWARGAYKPWMDQEDYIQEAYIALLLSLRSYAPGKGNFFHWFKLYLKRAFRLASGMNRRTPDPLEGAVSLDAPLRSQDGEIIGAEPLIDPEDLAGEAEARDYAAWRQRRVEAALEKLPETCRHVVRMIYWDQLSLRDTAEALGVRKTRAAYLHTRAIDLLRRPPIRNMLEEFA